jgi:hypothetical protein
MDAKAGRWSGRGVRCPTTPGGPPGTRGEKSRDAPAVICDCSEMLGLARSTRDLSDCWSGNAAEAVSGFHRVLAEARCRQLIPFNSGFAVLWAASHECSGLVTGRTFPPIFVYQTAYDKDL